MADTDFLFSDTISPLDPGGMVALPPAPTPSPETPPAPLPFDAQPRIAELETLIRQQADQWRADSQRTQDLFAQEQAQSRQTTERMVGLIESLTQRLAQPATTPPPARTFGDIIEDVALDPSKKAEAEAYLQERIQQAIAAAQGRSAPSQQAQLPDAQRPMTVQEYETRNLAQQLRQQAVSDFASRNTDVLNDPQARTLLMARYAELGNDPMTRYLYPADPSGVSQIELVGKRFDLRVLDRAAAEVRQQRGVQQTQHTQDVDSAQTAPAQMGGSHQQPPRQSPAPMIPSAIAALLRDPTISKAMQHLTKAKDPRTHAKMIYDHIPQDVRTQWQQQAILARPETQRG